MSMTIGSTTDALANVSSPANQISIATLKMGLDASSSTAAQLLQQMPPAPQPMHLGQSVNVLA
jgi:hypothetical protein